MTIFDYLSILSYSITAIGFLMTNMFWLRTFIFIACVMDANIFFFIRPGSPLWVQVMMNLLFALINVFALIRLIRDRFPPGFEGEIGILYRDVFHQLPPSQFKLLLKIGRWETIEPGVTIIKKGDTDINPMFVIDGKVVVEQNNVILTSLEKGAILGEINFLTDVAPENSVITDVPTRLFILPRTKLLKLIEQHPPIKSVIYAVFGCNIAFKLKMMNKQRSS